MSLSLNDAGVVVEMCFHISAIVGGFLALLKWSKGQKTMRARYLKVLLGEYNKAEIQDFCLDVERTVMEDVDVDEFTDEQSKTMRKTLRFFSYLCQAMDAGLINTEEFAFFASQIRAVLSDQRVRRYMEKDYVRNREDSSIAPLRIMAVKRGWINSKTLNTKE